MTPDDALAALSEGADPARAADMARYHKVARPYLGLTDHAIDALARTWRETLSTGARLDLARALWATDIHEARIAAAKLLTQARIRPDDTDAWELIKSWIPECDGWSIADHAAIAGQKRLVWDPSRLDEIAAWATSPHLWTRRATLVMTLHWTRLKHPGATDTGRRERILGWAATYVDDPDRFLQQAVASWLRDLSRHDPERTRAFLATYGERMKPAARREAARHLEDGI